ncbi:hypothetical protein EDD11_006451 [Mortierella claussenii]|nr:hypothetical protein EDD11_006451 [Mortierella claussenii]
MPNVQSKFSAYRKLIPARYVNRVTLELQRTFLIALSLLKTHRRKAILLSLGPATILKFITVMLPIIKLLPPTVKAIRTLGYFTSTSSSNRRTNNHSHSSSGNQYNGTNSLNALSNRDINASAAAEGLGMSMDELSEILWTPAEDTYWERVNRMVTRFGLFKTLGVTLAGVRPGRVEIVVPFRAEISGEGGAFHASLLPTLIAMTSQLTGMTLLSRHFTLKPIDFKCNILSDCDASTFLLLSRGAVVVRGDHSITVKVEVLKASGLVPGSSEIVNLPTATATATANGPSMFSWKSWLQSPPLSSASLPTTSTSPGTLVPGTGIERSKFVVCASGMQTSVVVQASMDQNNEEAYEFERLKREREQKLKRASSTSLSGVSSSSSLSPSAVDMRAEDVIVLGDSYHPAETLRSETRAVASRPMSPTTGSVGVLAGKEGDEVPLVTRSMDRHVLEINPPSLQASLTHSAATTITAPTLTHSVAPMSYASAVRQRSTEAHETLHVYEETSDTEAWQR